MAELQVQDDQLVLHLTPAEKVEGVHGDLHAPLASVSAIELLDDAHAEADRIGFKVGTRIGGVIEVAAVHGLKRNFFAAVHHDTPRGVRISFSEGAFDEWIVGCDDPEAVAARLRPSL
jgi:hypothetical protein